MNKSISFHTINCGNEGGENSIDLASALLFDESPEMMDEIMSKLSKPNTTLYLPATPSQIDTGDVASNFRYKHDATINNNVAQRWLNVFEEYKKNESKNPVVITSVGRNHRFLTFKLVEDGQINVVNNEKDNLLCEVETEIMKSFLEASNITPDHMKKIRMASEGARFNTYMADMIGFNNMINWEEEQAKAKISPSAPCNLFIYSFAEPYIVTPECKYHRSEVNGQPMLKPVVINGKEWNPKPEFNYMYFHNPSYKDSSVSQYFKERNSLDLYMEREYMRIFKALDNTENFMKKMIRNYLKNLNTYSRLSDFWVNDIDDAFTILMIINAYRYAELDEVDKMILKQFEDIAKVWYDELSE
jgi:hypothetical protein